MTCQSASCISMFKDTMAYNFVHNNLVFCLAGRGIEVQRKISYSDLFWTTLHHVSLRQLAVCNVKVICMLLNHGELKLVSKQNLRKSVSSRYCKSLLVQESAEPPTLLLTRRYQVLSFNKCNSLMLIGGGGFGTLASPNLLLV